MLARYTVCTMDLLHFFIFNFNFLDLFYSTPFTVRQHGSLVYVKNPTVKKSFKQTDSFELIKDSFLHTH